MEKHTKPHRDGSALKAAFLVTVPVLLGYSAIGTAFGLLLVHAGYPVFLAPIMSIVIYAGAVQYLAVGFFSNGIGLAEAGVITFLVNSRHMMYGISLLKQFSETGRYKPYLIFALTDETYALLTSVKVPEGVNPSRFYFLVSMFDQSYWVAGSIFGAIIGGMLPFDTKGLEFALTALFVVLLIEQVKKSTWKLPFGIAILSSSGVILAAGTQNMLIISLVVSVVLLLCSRRLEPERKASCGDSPC